MYKVIIAEDEMFVRLGIKMSVRWQDLGMEVVADCANGQQALEAWEKYHPDIVITDIKMPIMDGMELIGRIREKDKRTRIIILTVLEEFDLAKQAISFGVSDYILKLTMTPQDMEEVLTRVKKELEAMPASKTGEPSGGARQDKIIKNYIFYHVYDAQMLKKLPLDEKNLAMAVMELDNYEAVCEYLMDSHGSLVTSAVQNILEEMLARDGKGICIYLEDRSFLIITSRKDQEHGHIAQMMFTDRLEKIRRQLKTYYNALVSFGISRLYSGFEYLPEMYRQCREALSMKFYKGCGQNLFYADESEEEKKRCVEETLARLEAPEFGEAGKEAVRELAVLKECPQKTVAVNMFSRLISSRIYHRIPDRTKAVKIVNNYSALLEKAGTLQELADIYIQCVQYKSDLSASGGISKTVSDIISYIGSHYMHAMTLDSIAEYVSMSPNYICGLFKREMGINLMSYIMKYRIQKAEKLMVTTHMKSYEIAEKVGFSDESYFSRCFKKMTGMSPNEYRKKYYRKDMP